MNQKIQDFARNELKASLAQLPEGWQKRFKQIYSHKNPNADINEVVEKMPEDKLDWAMQQVENSLKKINKQK